MSAQPDFATMTTPQLRAYVLAHREDEQALHVFLDRRRSENPNLPSYKADEDVSAAISAYLERQRLS